MARRISSVESAKKKLSRAAEHLKAIQGCVTKYSAERPYKIIPRETKGEKTKEVRILTPPIEISILAGEMLYQMRSALDHLAFGLVEHNASGVLLPRDWDRRCEFPLFTKIPNQPGSNPAIPYNPPLPYAVLAKNLPGISVASFTFIESLQPYYGRGVINNALGFLAKLSNIDKHRYLNVVAPLVQRTQTVRYRSGTITSGVDAFYHGTQFYANEGRKSDRPVQVNRRFRVPVIFNELDFRGDPITIPLERLLKLVLNEIKTHIVPALDKFIKQT